MHAIVPFPPMIGYGDTRLVQPSLVVLVTASLAVLSLTLRRIVVTYRWFAGYLVTTAVRGALAVAFEGRSNLYGWIYFLTFPIVWGMLVMAAREDLSIILSHHPGIQRFGRRVMAGGVIAGVLLSIWTIATPTSTPLSPVYRNFLRTELFLDFTLLLFWTISLVFISWFPLSLSKNVVRHSLLLTTAILLGAVSTALTMMATRERFQLPGLIVAWLLACTLTAWCFALTKRGESRTSKLRTLAPAEEDRLLAQLDSIDHFLLRADETVNLHR